VETGGPPVVIGALALPQRNHLFLEVRKFFEDPFGEPAIRVGVELA
jgi:hypothetical protein